MAYDCRFCETAIHDREGDSACADAKATRKCGWRAMQMVKSGRLVLPPYVPPPHKVARELRQSIEGATECRRRLALGNFGVYGPAWKRLDDAMGSALDEGDAALRSGDDARRDRAITRLSKAAGDIRQAMLATADLTMRTVS